MNFESSQISFTPLYGSIGSIFCNSSFWCIGKLTFEPFTLLFDNFGYCYVNDFPSTMPKTKQLTDQAIDVVKEEIKYVTLENLKKKKVQIEMPSFIHDFIQYTLPIDLSSIRFDDHRRVIGRVVDLRTRSLYSPTIKPTFIKQESVPELILKEKTLSETFEALQKHELKNSKRVRDD